MAHIRLPKFIYAHSHYKTDGVHALYANIFLRQFALYTFGLFVPLYLIKLAQNNYSVSLTQALGFVAFFYLAIRIVYLLLYLPMVNLIYRVGTRWSIFASNIFLALFLVCLRAAKIDLRFLAIGVLFSAVYLALYWTSFRYLLASDLHDGKRGQEIARIGILDRMGQILGPAFGGLLIADFGFSVLFAVSVGLVFLSSIPPFFMRHHEHIGKFTISKAWNLFSDKKNLGVFVSIAATAVRDITDGIFWPVFAFVLLAGYDKLGFFYSITGFLTIFSLFGTGRLYDKLTKRRLLKAGTGIVSLVWAGRALVFSAGSLYFIEGVKRLLNPVLWIAHDGLVYEWGRGKPMEMMVSRMIVWQAAAAIWLLFWAVAFWFGAPLRAIFAATAVAVLGHTLILKK